MKRPPPAAWETSIQREAMTAAVSCFEQTVIYWHFRLVVQLEKQ
jgi:hypothetical protein